MSLICVTQTDSQSAAGWLTDGAWLSHNTTGKHITSNISIMSVCNALNTLIYMKTKDSLWFLFPPELELVRMTVVNWLNMHAEFALDRATCVVCTANGQNKFTKRVT